MIKSDELIHIFISSYFRLRIPRFHWIAISQCSNCIHYKITNGKSSHHKGMCIYLKMYNYWVSHTKTMSPMKKSEVEWQAIGPYEDLLTTVKRRQLQWNGHVSCSSGMAKTILQGTVPGGRQRGRQKKRWEDNLNTHLVPTH